MYFINWVPCLWAFILHGFYTKQRAAFRRPQTADKTDEMETAKSAGAEAHLNRLSLLARLKSCPVTKQSQRRVFIKLKGRFLAALFFFLVSIYSS
jgi:hypothetical protein